MQNLIVQKYGGTSVETPEKIIGITRRIQELKQQGHALIVVVSAMGKTTDQLMTLSRQVANTPNRRELDMLLSAGERISMALLGLALNDRGIPAVSLTGSQSGIITTNLHTGAAIDLLKPVRIAECLEKNKVVLVAGFQGVSKDKEVTTLGRGGSDLTAVALAAHFQAKRCDILTDVAGLFTADPRAVKAARNISRCSTRTLMRLSGLGAKVMHHRAAALAFKYKVPLWIGHSVEQEKGTFVEPIQENMETPLVTAVVGRQQGVIMAKIRFAPSARKQWIELQKKLERTGLAVPAYVYESGDREMIQLTEVFMDTDLAQVRAAFDQNIDAKTFQWSLDDSKAFVAVSGTDLTRSGGLAWEAAEQLSQAGIPVAASFAHPCEMLWVVDKKDFESATNLLHRFVTSS